VLTDIRLNICDGQITMNVQLYHNASISKVLRWTLIKAFMILFHEIAKGL
jgi:hypothetical protein